MNVGCALAKSLGPLARLANSGCRLACAWKRPAGRGGFATCKRDVMMSTGRRRACMCGARVGRSEPKRSRIRSVAQLNKPCGSLACALGWPAGMRRATVTCRIDDACIIAAMQQRFSPCPQLSTTNCTVNSLIRIIFPARPSKSTSKLAIVPRMRVTDNLGFASELTKAI